LFFVKHSERAADLHSHLRNAANHLENIFEILALFYLAPRGAHAETRRTLSASASGKFRYFVYGEQSATGYLCRVMRALRAVGAIFRTSARLNREQAAELDAPRVMEFPMQLLRLEQEIGKRLPVNPANLFASPGVTHV
jgi:hypothetical protein